MDQETIGVGAMIDVKIGELSFRLTQAEARKLRDLLTAALGDARQHPVVDAWPPTIVPVLPPTPLPPAIYCGGGVRVEDPDA